jgi:hydroxymethylpyrimidine pyrophosphatase-like HAD family hydrolase
VVVNALEPDLVYEVFDLIVRAGAIPFVSTFDGAADRLYFSSLTHEGMRWYHDDRLSRGDPRLCFAPELKQTLSDRVVCLTVIGEASSLAELELAIRDHSGDRLLLHLMENRYSPGWHWLTIHDRRATKDQGVQTLRDMYGFAGGDLVVFGDEANDISLFRIASHAVAVSNASSVLAPHATTWIGSNDDDSVARYILADWTTRRNVL